MVGSSVINAGVRMLAVLIVYSLVSCSGGTSSIGGRVVPVYLPFIESISTDPAVVHAGDPYNVVAHVSCQLNPAVLRGGPAGIDQDQSTGNWQWTYVYHGMAPSVSNQTELVIVNNPWIMQPAQSGPVVSSFVIRQKNGSSAGTQVFQFLTANSPEWGGLESSYIGAPTPTVDAHPHAVYREFEVTILPAEE